MLCVGLQCVCVHTPRQVCPNHKEEFSELLVRIFQETTIILWHAAICSSWLSQVGIWNMSAIPIADNTKCFRPRAQRILCWNFQFSVVDVALPTYFFNLSSSCKYLSLTVFGVPLWVSLVLSWIWFLRFFFLLYLQSFFLWSVYSFLVWSPVFYNLPLS